MVLLPTSENITSNQKHSTRWQHKDNKKIFNVMPWWDCFSELIDKPNDLAENDEWTDRKYAIGVLAQVGYLLENEDGAWFGVGPDAKQHFDDLGPLKVTETNESNESTPTT